MSYSVYFLCEDHIRSVEELPDCYDDDDARKTAIAMLAKRNDFTTVEVWDRERKVYGLPIKWQSELSAAWAKPNLSDMPHRESRNRKPIFVDREVVAKAAGRFTKADRQRTDIKADTKREVVREQQRIMRTKKKPVA